MNEPYGINRLDYRLLTMLHSYDYKSHFNSMTISEMINNNSDENGKCSLGRRLTIYKKLQKLVDASYVNKGIRDNHADTYYLTEEGIKLIEDTMD